MKSKDLSLLIVVGIVSAVFALILSNLFFSAPKRQVEVEVVEAISAEFKTPSPDYFNETSINPTYSITIGQTTNNEPFKQNTTEDQ